MHSNAAHNICTNIILFVLLKFKVGRSSEGPIAYGVCQTGCNLGVVACFAAAGQLYHKHPVLYISIALHVFD